MKTLFISIFSSVVVTNFSLPGGVFEQLIGRRPKDVRIVFLTSVNLTHKLERYLRPGEVSMEIIEKVEPRGALQKAFQFFYAYLVFTGTTRILATFGARADIPPAGGNRHVAPFKAAIANTFGRSRWVKTVLVPALFMRVFRRRPYRALFDRYQPSALFVPNIAFLPDIELVAEAKRRGVHTTGMAANWDHLNKYFIPLQTDVFLAQNEPMRTEAVELQAYRREQTVPVGFAQFDMYPRFKQNPIPREQFRRHFGLPESGKLIVFISGAAYALDEPDILKGIVGWIGEGKFGPNARVLVRPYVMGRDRASEEGKYRDLLQNPAAAFNWLVGGESEENRLYNLSMLYYADVVISIFSTMSIEAALFDKPNITIGFDGHAVRPAHQSIVRLEGMSHFRHVLDTGSVRIARSFPDLLEKLTTYLAHPERDADRRRALIEKMCYRTDARSAERVVDAILAPLAT